MSKKRSDSSSAPGLPPEPIVFFTDAVMGRYGVPDALRAAGAEVRAHHDVFPDAHLATHERLKDDVVWLGVAGDNGWAVITKDHLLGRPIEREQLLAARVRAFILMRCKLDGPQIAELLVKWLVRMRNLCGAHQPPFIATINSGGVEISKAFTAVKRRKYREALAAKKEADEDEDAEDTS